MLDRRRFKLAGAAWRAFQAALDEPPQDRPRLRRLLGEPTILDRLASRDDAIATPPEPSSDARDQGRPAAPSLASSRTMFPGLQARPLGGEHVLHVGALPPALIVDDAGFAALWALHPGDYHVISMHGREVPTPRWQQAYGADYRYTGQVNRALPLTPTMEPYLEWARGAIDRRLNGLLFNWYDGALGHYIGKHRDSRIGMIEGAPIVTISFGEERTFRIRPWRGAGHHDFAATHGSVFVLPYATNLAYTHEVPHAARHRGRRISITLRAFTRAAPG